MCENCINELKKVNKFIRLLKHSYLSLENAYHEIRQLEGEKDMVPDNYESVKNNILNNTIKRRFQEQAEEGDSTDKEGYMSDESNVEVENINISYDSDSSNDELVSIRCKVTLKNKETQVSSTSQLYRKKKEDLSIDNSVTKSMPLLSKAEEGICPICSAKIRGYSEHLLSDHNLDWIKSKCLICPYHNENKETLLEHSKLCHGVVLKVEYVDPEEMKVDWRELVNENVELDIEREESETSEGEDEFSETIKIEPIIEPKQNKKLKYKKKFTCNKCEDAIFNNYPEIDSHFKVVHAEETDCILCEEQFKNPFALLHHMMKKHGDLKCCKLCLVSFNTSSELAAHYKSMEHNTKCSVCKVQFRNLRALYRHRRKKHLNTPVNHTKYKCPECPKEFTSHTNRKRHIRGAHNDLAFLCDICGQSYSTKESLKVHILKYHEGIKVERKDAKKKFICDSCGWKLNYSRTYAIVKHKAEHIGHNFVCKICHESFAIEEEFNKHVEDLGHQPFKCDQCHAEFVRLYSYKVHLKNHETPGWNKNLTPKIPKDDEFRNEKGLYVCSYCSKICKNKFRLLAHLRVHSDERPFKCHLCPKAFKTEIHRKTHMDIHLGIKRWICKFCKKAFGHATTLKCHEMIHTGERPHKCPECGKGFMTTSALKKHRDCSKKVHILDEIDDDMF